MLLEKNGFHDKVIVDQPKLIREPLRRSHILNKFQSFDSTACIGTEFRNVDLVDWITGPNSDEYLKELSIIIAERGVVFFRGQDKMTDDLQKILVQRLGEHVGRPKSNSWYIHPLAHHLQDDLEVGTVDGNRVKTMYNSGIDGDKGKKQSNLREWHSDSSFERAPPDITSMRLIDVPRTGGDTMWASGYEIYDRFSETYQRFLDGLTCTFDQPGITQAAEKAGCGIYQGPRGSPENVGSDISSIHPFVRTHPITGWKAVFAGALHCMHVNDVTKVESEELLRKVLEIISHNPDLQVRHHWESPGDLALWDNRCVYHAAIHDHAGQGKRKGVRIVGVGEVPYLDPASKSRRQALAENLMA